jgi:hypothetical protein
MSSRSLAAARAKRAGDQAPPVSGNRPVTSIGSQAAFAQQMPPGMGYNMPPPPNNVRIAKSMQPNTQTQKALLQQSAPPQYSQFYEKPQTQQSSPQANGLPFSKLSISDAIGLITLRLGRVEQWIIETDHEEQNKEQSNIPDNHKIIDNSVLTTMISRLDSLEKNSTHTNNDNVSTEQITKLTQDIQTLNELFKKMGEDINKHTIEIAKNTEQVFRFNRELTETKDILKTFMLRYDQFTEDTKNNFQDFENALSDLEHKIVNEPDNNNADETSEDTIENEPTSYETEIIDASIMSVDLKNIIRQELANTNL